MAGNVVYPKDNKKGCKEFDEFGISFKSRPGALPTVVLLDRGSEILFASTIFFFHLKVHHAFFFFLFGLL